MVACRTTDPEVLDSNACGGTIKPLTVSIRTIPQPIPLHHSEIPEIVRGEKQKTLWHSDRVQDYRSRRSPDQMVVGQRNKCSQDQSEKYHHLFHCTRFKYLKLSEVECTVTVAEVMIAHW